NDYPEATDGQRLGIETRFTSDPAASIREAVLEAECDAVLAEWPHPGAQREHRLRSILRSLVADTERKLIITRPAPAGAPPQSVLAALRGGPNSWLGLSVAAAVAIHAQATLTLLHISDLGHHPKHRRSETAAFHALAEAVSDVNPHVVELTAEKPAEVLFREGQRYDTVI